MTGATTHAVRGPARATIRSVVATGVGTYRRNFARIVVAAVLVFAPIDLIVTLATAAARDVAENSDTLSLVLWTSGTAVGIAGTMLSLVFFSGVIDRIVAVDQHGEEYLPLVQTLRRLPTWRLLLASSASAALVVLGLVLFLIPGLVLMVLFAVVGPVIVIEDLRAWRGLRRSAGLTWPHVLLVVVTVLVPTTLDEQVSSWLEHFRWYEHPWIALPLDVGSTIVVGGLVGVLEVTLAHALIADQRRRREKRAVAARAAAEPPPAGDEAGAGQEAER
jgi:hypothetical protein